MTKNILTSEESYNNFFPVLEMGQALPLLMVIWFSVLLISLISFLLITKDL